MKGYATALLWSKVFLQGKSFTSFSGSNVAFALLFPMETLFESYVASLMRKQLQGTDYSFSAQDKGYHLFDNPKKFMLRPDIVIKNKIIKTVFVMDTKWKLLSLSKANAGISQADMYQMYAYQKKYNAKNITLLYPKTAENIDEGRLTFISNDGVTVNVKFVDLYDKNSISDILNSIIHMQTTRIPRYLGVDSSHIQVLAPMKAGICGVENLNKCLQEKINPLDKYKMEIVRDKVIYREKDRVMQITNNYERSWSKDGEYGQGVFNGDIGIITKIDISTNTTTVLFEDGRVADYLLSELNELVLSYAITIHKSQGSEFDVVIIPAITGAPMLLTKNLLYTAVTRAKKMVVLVGTKRAIRIMVSNNYTEVRYSMLKYFLKNIDIENTLLK
jgi:hypothetical protein